MNRCATSFAPPGGRPVGRALALASTIAATLALLAPPSALAQNAARNFPRNALRGKIEFGTPPVIKLDGTVTRMSPGSRIHGLNNLLVMSSQLVGRTQIVDYTTETGGQVYEVWILSEAEAAKKPWPSTAAEAAAWTFDPVAQTWTKP